MHLLLTRPQGRNEPLARKLTALGHDSTLCPMVAIEPLTPPAAPFAGAEGAFFVSKTAVVLADRALQGRWPSLPCFAVGQGTAAALQCCGIEPHCPGRDQETSEGVLALPALQQLPKGAFVIVRGEGGRPTFAQALSSQGFQVRHWVLYRRAMPAGISEQQVQDWRQRGVNAILATSGEIVENLFAVVPLVHHDWLRRQHWLVPVARVAQLARQHGCHSISVLGGASDDAILGRIGKMNHYGEDPEGS
ncbi:uroporphyrinogen-III synthase [Ferrimonas pelagia]|uniref:Uroporphyrinogen-III synthase n=1 Tax=Ferrimonas pelagia TaxID=1177826 RepID=A0ABP9EX84_9GAMM